MQYAYLFEARGIQRFLFASGKLRDMLGGSEMVDFICAPGGYLDQVLNALDLKPDAPRRAGGAFYLVFVSLDDARRFQAAWRLAAAQWLPGLERVDALCEGSTAKQAIKDSLKKLQINRNVVQADVPRPGPLSERSPRTGLVAVSRADGESLDASTATMRKFRRPEGGLTLPQRFRLEDDVIWPSNFEENAPVKQRFPLAERRLVGLLHADGNGLGELLRLLNEACEQAEDKTYIELYRCFSEGVTAATVAAAAEATTRVLLPAAVKGVMPARPLVLGGDDLSMVIRADLALPFTEAFLKAFEQTSLKAMADLKLAFSNNGLATQAEQLPPYLTACAGITFMKCSQPFRSAYDLAEGLCKRAKTLSRDHRKDRLMPSSVAFLKVTDSLLADVDEMISQTQSVTHERKGEDKQRLDLGLTAYGIAAGTGLPLLSDLYRLRCVFADDADGKGLNDRPLRELATLVHADPGQARQSYRRWRQVSQRRMAKAVSDFDLSLAALVGNTVADLPFGMAKAEPGKPSTLISPLADLLTLLTISPFASAEEGK